VDPNPNHTHKSIMMVQQRQTQKDNDPKPPRPLKLSLPQFKQIHNDGPDIGQLISAFLSRNEHANHISTIVKPLHDKELSRRRDPNYSDVSVTAPDAPPPFRGHQSGPAHKAWATYTSPAAQPFFLLRQLAMLTKTRPTPYQSFRETTDLNHQALRFYSEKTKQNTKKNNTKIKQQSGRIAIAYSTRLKEERAACKCQTTDLQPKVIKIH